MFQLFGGSDQEAKRAVWLRDWRKLRESILATADIFDPLSADRPYRPGMPRERVLEILRQESGSGLDPACVTAAARLP